MVNKEVKKSMEEAINSKGYPTVGPSTAVGPGAGPATVSIRICVVGDCGVGKTTLVSRLCGDATDDGLTLGGLMPVTESWQANLQDKFVQAAQALSSSSSEDFGLSVTGSSNSGASTVSTTTATKKPDQLPLSLYSPTTGCVTHVKLMKDPLNNDCEYFVEILDIGGS
jgi:GTPase SAR1 family protein